VYAQERAFPPEKTVGHLQKNPRTISGIWIAAARTPVCEIAQDL